MPFIEIKQDSKRILLMLHHIVNVEETEDGNCNITTSNDENYYDIENYEIVKSTIRESKCQ